MLRCLGNSDETSVQDGRKCFSRHHLAVVGGAVEGPRGYRGPAGVGCAGHLLCLRPSVSLVVLSVISDLRVRRGRFGPAKKTASLECWARGQESLLCVQGQRASRQQVTLGSASPGVLRAVLQTSVCRRLS